MTVSAVHRDTADESREYISELRDLFWDANLVYTQNIVLGSLFGVDMVCGSPSAFFYPHYPLAQHRVYTQYIFAASFCFARTASAKITAI